MPDSNTYLQVEQGAGLVVLALVEGLLSPLLHDLAHGLLVGLGQADPPLQVTHLLPGGLNVLPHPCKEYMTNCMAIVLCTLKVIYKFFFQLKVKVCFCTHCSVCSVINYFLNCDSPLSTFSMSIIM